MAGDDALFRLRTFAENLVRHRFLHGDGQDALARLVAYLDVVLEERHLLERALLEHAVRHVVDGESQFGVLVETVVVVLLEVAASLGVDDLAHEFDGGVVLSRVLCSASCDGGLAQCILQALEPDVVRPRLRDAQGLGGVADHRHPELSGAERQGVAAGLVGARDGAPFDEDVGKGQRLARLGVGDGARQALGHGLHHAAQEEQHQGGGAA